MTRAVTELKNLLSVCRSHHDVRVHTHSQTSLIPFVIKDPCILKDGLVLSFIGEEKYSHGERGCQESVENN